MAQCLQLPTFQEYDLESECSGEVKGGRSIRSALSLEIYGLQREQHVYFSNQEYYRRLEELKSAHLRNMAELERMYISQSGERHGEEDDRGLERTQNREDRLSIRLDMLDFHIKLFFLCVVSRLTPVTIVIFQIIL